MKPESLTLADLDSSFHCGRPQMVCNKDGSGKRNTAARPERRKDKVLVLRVRRLAVPFAKVRGKNGMHRHKSALRFGETFCRDLNGSGWRQRTPCPTPLRSAPSASACGPGETADLLSSHRTQTISSRSRKWISRACNEPNGNSTACTCLNPDMEPTRWWRAALFRLEYQELTFRFPDFPGVEAWVGVNGLVTSVIAVVATFTIIQLYAPALASSDCCAFGISFLPPRRFFSNGSFGEPGCAN